MPLSMYFVFLYKTYIRYHIILLHAAVMGDYSVYMDTKPLTGTKTVQKWCTREGLAVNPTKTSMIVFNRRRNLQQLKEPKV